MTFTSEQLLESILVLMVFYLAYQLFFINQASFKLNRYFLLVGIISSFIIPFIEFSAPNVSQLDFYIQLKTVDIFGSGSSARESRSDLTFNQIIDYIYLAGAILFTIRFIYQLLSMSRLFIGSEIVGQKQGRIVYTKKDHPVFSFLSFIFIGSKSENVDDLNIILDHERMHIKQKHSIDLLLLELLAIVQWFNPIVWHYRKLVKQNHEFLADRGVINTGVSENTYQELLLGNYKSLSLGFANSFNHSLTFKRLVMMKKNISKKSLVARILIIAPIVIVSIYLISCSKTESLIVQTDPVKNNSKSDLTINSTDSVYESYAIDEKPQFPGGDSLLINYVAQNTVYPELAKKDKIEGTVYVRFIVKKDGTAEAKEVMRKENPLLEAEAIRVVNSLPKWEPGKKNGKPVDVWFIMPIKFRLQ